jgi:hypothetical protein
MTLIMALSPAVQSDIAIIAVWFVGFPALVTGLIAYAIVQGLGERRENEAARNRNRGGA